MGRPTKHAAHRLHSYCKPLRSSIDHQIRLRQLLDHNDVMGKKKRCRFLHGRIREPSMITTAVIRDGCRQTQPSGGGAARPFRTAAPASRSVVPGTVSALAGTGPGPAVPVLVRTGSIR
ncbi:hypothetical protein EVAR_21053_1 [Eumeta japonica]|uniref:Uncharacterized protein n=1 Tax=Eumeta variegata TaxID=151549 RepID=A0A4C1V0J5_EUMVA|nr:hypothetical protein EVAR_21053_1 [Eumeta japonica]